MGSIFPPQGSRDDTRYAEMKREEREYSLFCVEFCSDILDSRPFHIEALELAANHFTALGYYSDGLALDRRLAELRPEEPGILYNLACSLALIGKIDDAVSALSRAVENGYHDYRHMVADDDLRALRGDPRFVELLGLLESRRE